MIERPYTGNANIDFDGIELKIKIPTKKNWFIIIFFSVWLGGWYFGETSAINEIFSKGVNDAAANGFMSFWLAGWSVGGIFALSILLWMLFGNEKIVFSKNLIALKKGLLDWNFIVKQYETSQIKNLELNPQPTVNEFFGQRRNIGDYAGFSGGKIRFDYGLKTVKFGVNIDVAEARYLIDEIKKKGFYKD
jgi:hypothetical protein